MLLSSFYLPIFHNLGLAGSSIQQLEGFPAEKYKNIDIFCVKILLKNYEISSNYYLRWCLPSFRFCCPHHILVVAGFRGKPFTPFWCSYEDMFEARNNELSPTPTSLPKHEVLDWKAGTPFIFKSLQIQTHNDWADLEEEYISVLRILMVTRVWGS
jgi:hypothetical protein